MQKIHHTLNDYWQVLLIYPALFLFIFSNDINLIAQHGLVYRKTCLHEFNQSTCNSIQSQANVSARVQELASQTQIVLNVAFMVPAIVSLIHLSSIADRRLNYELPLIVSLVGSLVQAFMCIFAVHANFTFFYYWLIASQAVNGMCGAGSLAFISSCFSHVAVYENRRPITTSTCDPNQVYRNFNYLK